MTPESIIDRATKNGVLLSVTPAGKIKAAGNQNSIDKLLPLILEHKPELLKLLQQEPDHPEPYLKNGELIMQGLPPEDKTILDVLLELSAPDDVIEKYVDPNLTPAAWSRWKENQENRNERC